MAGEEINVKIRQEPINELNFLRWHEPQAGAIPLTGFVNSGRCLEVYAPDARTESACKVIATDESDVYALPMVYEDTVSFCINTDYDLGTTANLSLALLRKSALTYVLTPVASYVTEGGKKYLTASFKVPCANDGNYNLVLIRTVSGVGEIMLVSNPVRVMNFQSPQHPTLLVDFRHSVSQFGYPYTTGSTFRNKFRIDALLTKPRPTESITTYEDRNRQTRFIGLGKLERSAEFKTDYLDHPTHEAIAAMFLHNDVKLNGKAYLKTDSYETELDNDVYALYQGSTRLKDLAFTQLQNNC